MIHAITIEVPDEIYQPLIERARAIGQTPESVASGLVAQAVRRVESGSRILRWAGTVESSVPDVAERHDGYVGQRLFDELRDQ